VIHWCLRKLQELGEGLKRAPVTIPVKTQVYPPTNELRPAEIEDIPPSTDKPAQTSEGQNAKRLSEDKSKKSGVLLDRNSSTTSTDCEPDSRPRLRSQDKTYSASHANTSDFGVTDTVREKSRILLVDDNDINLKLLVRFVTKANYAYECATDGLQAVEAYKGASGDRNRAFRYVLMDISMPVMDGLAATREIREFEKRNRIEPRTVIVAMTGLASEMTQDDALRSGVDYFQIKPVIFKDLLKVLER
jgi:CheY-like chemotaxis protein